MASRERSRRVDGRKPILAVLRCPPWVRKAWRIGRLTWYYFRRDRCIDSAAAISYFALLSFIPFLVLTVSALGFVLVFVGSDYASREEFLHVIIEAVGAAMPQLREDIGRRIIEIMDAREAIGVVGAVGLVLTSSLVFSALENAFKVIFDIRSSRHVLISKLLFMGFIGSLVVFLVIGHYVFTFANSFVEAAGGRPLLEHVFSSRVLSKAASWLGTTVAFIGLLSYFGQKRVRPAYFLAGATVFFFLFEVARFLFSLYLEYVAQFSAIYGSLSTLMILIIWTFYTVVLFLACTELVKTLEIHSWTPPPHEEEDPGLSFSDSGPGG